MAMTLKSKTFSKVNSIHFILPKELSIQKRNYFDSLIDFSGYRGDSFSAREVLGSIQSQDGIFYFYFSFQLFGKIPPTPWTPTTAV